MANKLMKLIYIYIYIHIYIICIHIHLYLSVDPLLSPNQWKEGISRRVMTNELMQILWLAEQRQLKRKLGHSYDNPWSYRKSGFWATKSTLSCLERKKQLTAMTMKIFLSSDFIVKIEPQNMFLQNYLLLSNCRSLSQKFQSWCFRWVNVIHHFMNETKWWRRLNCDRLDK